jgi:hypothetical protein
MKNEYIPFGRIAELKSRPNADRIAFFIMPGVMSFDYKVVTFPNRKMLENCLRKGAGVAVVKNEVKRGMLLYPGLEHEAE